MQSFRSLALCISYRPFWFFQPMGSVSPVLLRAYQAIVVLSGFPQKAPPVALSVWIYFPLRKSVGLFLRTPTFFTSRSHLADEVSEFVPRLLISVKLILTPCFGVSLSCS